MIPNSPVTAQGTIIGCLHGTMTANVECPCMHLSTTLSQPCRFLLPSRLMKSIADTFRAASLVPGRC